MIKLWTPAEAAAYLGISKNALLRLDIPKLRLGQRTVRYRPEDIERYLETRRVA